MERVEERVEERESSRRSRWFSHSMRRTSSVEKEKFFWRRPAQPLPLLTEALPRLETSSTLSICRPALGTPGDGDENKTHIIHLKMFLNMNGYSCANEL